MLLVVGRLGGRRRHRTGVELHGSGLGHGLQLLQLGVGLVAADCPEWVVSFLGAAAAGVMRAADEQLVLKGLIKVEENADLYIGYQVAISLEKSINLWSTGTGPGGWGGDGQGADIN